MAYSNGRRTRSKLGGLGTNSYLYLAVLLIASAIYIGCMFSPPWLVDDVDSVQAQIARNMLSSGDWVSARLDGVLYLEKAPLIYWLIAIAYKVFGVHDWVARIPVVVSSVALAWLTAAFGVWAFGRRAGFYAGVVISTCIGLFLFTRIQIPDVMQTFTVGLALWAFLRVLDRDEPNPRLWAFLLAASMGVGLLLKSLIGVVFPVGAGLLFMLLTRQVSSREAWKRLRPFSGALIILAIAAPWHVLATLRNPPYFDFTLRSVPGQYHGFFWFFFINEQLLRFLNLRTPRDYNTVPRLYFWLFHLIWLFPWSVYLPAIFKLRYRAEDRAGRTRLLAACWIGVVLVFFTFSTTQEYYSMPCYPAFALLLGSAMAEGGSWIRRGNRVLAAVAACAAFVVFGLCFAVRNQPTPGDISLALSSNPGAYTLSLGHMEDLTLRAFAYLRLPLLIAGIAFLVGVAGNLRALGRKAFLSSALMMILFFHAARLAQAVFNPYLGSHVLAQAVLHSPPGELIVDHHYYDFSSVFFYTNKRALLLNGRFNNLVYGASAPDAPNVFINDAQWKDLWMSPQRYYLAIDEKAVPRLRALVGNECLNEVVVSGGKMLLTNHPIVVLTAVSKH
ncbi:MAG: glycosyltransferase family 39 protein [Acidobacteriaceae bacterium]|nr:glycosyltransferase family 39 protein [Acidobacteriaceae bacterium]